MSARCALVTGATGYVGAAVVTNLIAAGWHVLTAGRNANDTIKMDFASPASILEAYKPAAPIDACIHIAASHELHCVKDPLMAMTVNVTGTRALLEWCMTARIRRFVYISTFHVFGSNTGKLEETTTPYPVNDYGLTHFLAEKTVQMFEHSHQLEYCVLRPSNLIGSPKNWNMFNRWSLAPFDFCHQANHTGKIVLQSSGRQIRNWVDMDVLADFVVLACEGKCNGVRHVSGIDLSVIELAKLISNAWFEINGEKVELEVPVINHEEIEPSRHFTSSLCDKDKLPDIKSFVRSVENHLRNQIAK